MLFGNAQIKEKLLETAHKYAEENGFRLLYGAMVGGISKGLQYQDSDYDTRFLYIRKDFPEKICIPMEMPENKLIFRKYSEDYKVPFEWIPCWEFTSFLQFLLEPALEGRFSTGLYNVVGWTFASPYTWDPYGVGNKLFPLIQKVFYLDYCLEYHKNLMLSLIREKETIVAKDYLYALHSALSIDWMLKFHEYPPVYMRSLLFLSESSEFKKEIEKLIDQANNKANKYLELHSSEKMHETHNKVLTERTLCLDKYLNEIIEKTADFKMKKMQEGDREARRKKVELMYQIVYDSVYKEQNVRGVNG